MPSPTRILLFGATLFIASLLAVASASNAVAGTICGTVRDADTNLPVAQAAVFLFDNNGIYTGKYDDTDVNGQYCIMDVDPGTYTIQVQRDDYNTVIVTGVEVTDTSTDVDILATPSLRLRAWPNPANNIVQFEIGAASGTPITLEVYDVKGRFVRGWKGVSADGQAFGWNLRDFGGNPIASGVYFVRLRTAQQHVTHRFVRFR